MSTQTPQPEKVYQEQPEPPLFAPVEVHILSKHEAEVDFDERLAFAADAARDAYQTVVAEAAVAASSAFRDAMGVVGSIKDVRLFIAALARSMKEGIIDGHEAQKLLAVAERALHPYEGSKK